MQEKVEVIREDKKYNKRRYRVQKKTEKEMGQNRKHSFYKLLTYD